MFTDWLAISQIVVALDEMPEIRLLRSATDLNEL
jgi:hypothetical protein